MNEKSPGLEYSRRMFDGVLEWYKNADSKAQIILTIDGAFLAFLTNSIFMEQVKLSKILSTFGVETWFLLILMCLALAGSIISSILCLWSRTLSKKTLDEYLKTNGVDIKRSNTYAPQVMLFFQHISRLSENQMAEKLITVNEDDEIKAIAYQARILSENVMKKHRWVDIGFALAGLNLILFLCVGISYAVRFFG